MPLRRVPPAYSPLTVGALMAGLRASLGDRSAGTELEKTLRASYDADAALLTDSGTGALGLAIRAAINERPAPIALPAYSCYDLATAAVGADVSVLLYDIDPDTLGPDWTSLQRVVAAGVAAVVIAPLFGLPVDWSRATSIASAGGATLIEDAAQGAGASYGNQPLGSIGPLSVLSFGRGKGITGGAGGALLARASGVPLLRSASLQLGRGTAGGRALIGAGAQWLLGRPYLYGLAAALPFLRLGQTIYREPHPPRRMAAGSAGMVVHNLERVDGEAGLRRARAERLARAARAAGLRSPSPIPGSIPGYLRLPLLVHDPARVGGTALGVARAYPMALADLPQLRSRCRNCDEAFPGARLLARVLVTAPTHSRLSEVDMHHLEQWVGAQGAGRVA